jgi:hypothetical protein
MPATAHPPATWRRDDSFTLCPLAAMNDALPIAYPGIYALLHIDADGRETTIRVDEGGDVRRAVGQQLTQPLVVRQRPTHVAIRYEPARTPEEYLARRIQTARYRVKFKPAA